MPKKIDAITRRFIRNKSDESAAKNGCRVDLARGKFVCDWLQSYCFLYEGERAGKPIELMKWQIEDLIMPLFSWVKFSEDFKREIRRFRRAGIWLPKKNGKSPTLAGLNLYMLCGDGEEGQKCFSVALDGKQAMIQQEHIVQMVLASEPLREDCQINQTTKQVLYRPKNAVSRVVSGDNIQGQEGLNGSVFVDETHVVDARLMSVLKYAGASRAEPLQLEFSTAGNNPDGYGKKQFDKGRRVNSGVDSDETFFHRDWSIDSGVSEMELEKGIKKYIKSANPSLGQTVFESELVSEYHSAKGSLSTLADYKMYRLNLWQNAQNPWLDMAAWQANIKPEMYTPRALCNHRPHVRSARKKLNAWGGLDLSRVKDMSAFALAIEREEYIQIIIRLWMAERYAKHHADKADFKDWAERGFLKLTPGGTVDHGIVAGDIRKLCRHFNVMGITADQMYAERPMQEIVEGVFSEDGVLIDEGIGCERYWFAQTNASYAQPTEEFEAKLSEGKLILPSNDCLSWQASHVEVSEDAHGNKRPVKPKSKKGDELQFKKIDGIVAIIEACSLAFENKANAYEMGGVFSV